MSSLSHLGFAPGVGPTSHVQSEQNGACSTGNRDCWRAFFVETRGVETRRDACVFRFFFGRPTAQRSIAAAKRHNRRGRRPSGVPAKLTLKRRLRSRLPRNLNTAGVAQQRPTNEWQYLSTAPRRMNYWVPGCGRLGGGGRGTTGRRYRRRRSPADTAFGCHNSGGQDERYTHLLLHW